MTKEIVTKHLIQAPRSVVWRVLMDLDKWSEWNPFLVHLIGNEAAPGKYIRIKFRSNGMTMSPRVLVVDPEREFRWKGKLLFGGLFDGEHRFILKPCENDEQCTELEHGEVFSGALIPLMGKTLQETKANFEKMNVALNERCIALHAQEQQQQ